MFEPWQTSLVNKLKRADEDGDLNEGYAALCQTELGLYLLEKLEIHDPNELWVLLTKFDFPEYDQYDQAQQRALSNARLYLNFGSEAWRAALRAYQALPARWRMYQIGENSLERETGMTRVTDRQAGYEQALSDRPKIKQGNIRYPDENAPVHVVHPATGQVISFNLDPVLTGWAREQEPTQTRLPGDFPNRPTTIQVAFTDLRDYANKLNARLQALSFQEEGPFRNWVQAVDEIIRYRPILKGSIGKSLGTVNQGNLEIEGVTHIAGMVGAGKTTLAELLAMYAAEELSLRTTLVVGDTQTALDIANRINRSLLANRDIPIAVPLIGRTTRGDHYRRLANSPETASDHWGMAWLNPTCLIEGLIPLEELDDPFPQGEEPCGALLQKTKGSQEKEVKRTCPLFAICPSRQLDRQIPAAKIWVTTPQALTLAWLADPIDVRRFRYAEMVYHYSDLVVFDEIDADQQVVDDIYAPERDLINDRSGDLGEADRLSAGWFGRSPRDAVLRRRRKALQFCGIAADRVSDLIEGYPYLQKWVNQSGYFSPLLLFHKLSLELDRVGKGQDRPGANTEEDTAIEGNEVHRSMLERDNPYMDLLWEYQMIDKTEPRRDKGPAIQGLSDLMMDALYGEPDDFGANQDAKNWVLTQLAANSPSGQSSEIESVQLDELARKLELAVSLSALEYNLHEISYGYREEDEENDGAPDFQGLSYVPREFLGAMPISPLGPATGFRYANIERKSSLPHGIRLNRHLAYFRLASIGRYFLIHLDSLFNGSGYPGPAVLCMSGTSWMEDSDTHHFAVQPVGILEPTEAAKDAIRKSEFHYYPQRDAQGNAIRVSGSGNLEGSLIKMAIALSSRPQVSQSLLGLTMNRLKALGSQDPDWADRQRILILVNSYSQAKTVAQTIENQIRVELPDWQVFFLERANKQGGDIGEEDNWQDPSGARSVGRPELTAFGQRTTAPTVLVAPLLAVGRRHNILNQSGAAAFGAVIFATRPMKTPDDLSRWVYWINYQTIKLLQNPGDPAWAGCESPSDRLLKLRRITNWWWSRIDTYKSAVSINDPRLRRSMAATMAATIIQATGRLLRRGVPFLAYFADSAWAPQSANYRPDTPRTSLLVEMMDIVQDYCQNPIGAALFGPLNQALQNMEGVMLSKGQPTDGAGTEELESEFDSDTDETVE
ncbi:MAG: hypothetical protein PHQ40_05585 [Anaerolineaceae bacterium]|nr:hypothetical protein [Anaerolineaceae bacterium]